MVGLNSIEDFSELSYDTFKILEIELENSHLLVSTTNKDGLVYFPKPNVHDKLVHTTLERIVKNVNLPIHSIQDLNNRNCFVVGRNTEHGIIESLEILEGKAFVITDQGVFKLPDFKEQYFFVTTYDGVNINPGGMARLINIPRYFIAEISVTTSILKPVEVLMSNNMKQVSKYIEEELDQALCSFKIL